MSIISEEKLVYPKIPEDLLDCISYLEENGFEIYLVGGVCRDTLLGIEKDWKDFDFEVHFRPGHQHKDFFEIIDIYRNAKNLFLKTLKYNVCRVFFGEVEAEFSLARGEYFTAEAGHSNFEIQTIFDRDFQFSLIRRDFTINSILFRPTVEYYLDPYNGIMDLKNKKLKSQNPFFHKDWVRFFRLVRFSVNLHFEIHPHLEKDLKYFDLSECSSHYVLYELERCKNSMLFCSTSLRLIYKFEVSGISKFYTYFFECFKDLKLDRNNLSLFLSVYSLFVGELPKDFQVKQKVIKKVKKILDFPSSYYLEENFSNELINLLITKF